MRSVPDNALGFLNIKNLTGAKAPAVGTRWQDSHAFNCAQNVNRAGASLPYKFRHRVFSRAISSDWSAVISVASFSRSCSENDRLMTAASPAGRHTSLCCRWKASRQKLLDFSELLGPGRFHKAHTIFSGNSNIHQVPDGARNEGARQFPAPSSSRSSNCAFLLVLACVCFTRFERSQSCLSMLLPSGFACSLQLYSNFAFCYRSGPFVRTDAVTEACRPRKFQRIKTP